MLTITVECSPGSDITDSFQDAIELSNKLNCCIRFSFNSVTCLVKPNGSVRTGVEQWNEALSSKARFKFARSY